MIILDSTTESLEILLGGAVATNQLPFTVSFADHNAAAPSFTPGSTDGQTNGATAVTLVASPAASVQRQVKRINIYNADTATALVTIRLNNGGTFRTQFIVSILAGERIEYEDSVGFRVFDASGAMKGISSPFIVGTYILAQRTTNQTFAAGAFTTIIFGNEVSDALNEYNPATGEVTIKNTGRYLIAAYAQVEDAANTSIVSVSIFRNGVDFMRVGGPLVTNPGAVLGISVQTGGATFANLTVGDVITIRGFAGIQIAGGTLKFLGLSQLTNFSMMRVG
jgi:hypothetical protein